MNNKCAVCNKIVNKNNNVYRGFDCTFCSPYCRTKMWTIIYQEDINFNNPQLWSNKHYKSINNLCEINYSQTTQQSKQIIENKSVENKNKNKNKYDIYNDKSFDKYYNYYYNCSNYSIYDLIPIRYITTYILESSINLFR